MAAILPSDDQFASPAQKLVAAVAATPVENEDQQKLDEERGQFFDYSKSKPFVKEVFQQFTTTQNEITNNRKRRKVDIDIDSEKKAGRIPGDSTVIIDRVIDRNIAKEKPSYIAFLQQAKRLVIFRDRLDPNRKHDALESAFTAGMTYTGWLTPHYKTLDGSQVHGKDWIEVVFDTSKPLHCALEHVGSDRLIYSTDAEDVQNCARVERIYKLTRLQLDKFVRDYDFNKEQVNLLTRGNASDGSGTTPKPEQDTTFTIVKEMFKWEGIVYVGWRCLSEGPCTDWLLAPRKLYIGVDKKVVKQVTPEPALGEDALSGLTSIVPQQPVTQVTWEPVDEVSYPYVLLAYEETEEKEIGKKQGRAFKDKFLQEAKTAAITGYIRKLVRSHYVFASPNNAQDAAGASKLEEIPLKDNGITPVPVNFWSPPGPDPQTLEALQFLEAKNATDNGNMTYAVQSKSSGARTTKAEVDSAREDTALLSSVQISLYSDHVRMDYSLAWRIVQSQALQDLIDLYGEYTQGTDPATGDPTYDFVNNKEAIGRDFDIRAAGDVDVVQRQQLIEGMMQFWPLIQNTSIAGEFLGKLLRLQFAEDGEKWAQSLQSESQAKALLQQCFNILQAAIANPHELEQLGPQESANIQMLVQQIAAVLQQNPNQNGNSPEGNTTPQAGVVQQPADAAVPQGPA